MNKHEARELALKAPSVQALRDALTHRRQMAMFGGELNNPSTVNSGMTVVQALNILEVALKSRDEQYVMHTDRDILIATNVLRECL